MIGILRKHQQALLWVVAVVVISSFLVFFNPGQSSSRDSVRRSYGTLYGKPLKGDEVREANRQAVLASIVRFGGPDTKEAKRARFNLNQETYQRLLLRAKTKELGIQVDDKAVATWIRENLKDPKTGVVNYKAFVDRVLTPKDFTSADFEEYVRQDLALRHLIDVLGVSAGLITPREAEAEFRRENEQARASLVVFAASNYVSGVKLDSVSLHQFYTNQLPNYRIPERVVVNYVYWESSNYLAKAETQMGQISGLATKIEQFYNERGADAFKDENGTVLAKEPALALIRRQSAMAEAAKLSEASAREFANELYAIEPVKAENIVLLAAKKGLIIHKSEPFATSGVAPGLEDLANLGSEVAKLTPEQPFSIPVSGLSGTVVAALASKIPSEVPPFEAVESRIREDKKRFDSREAARNAATSFAISLTNGLAQGKTLAEIAAAEKQHVTELAPFSLSSESIADLSPSLNISQIKDTVFNLKPGTASRVVTTFDGGFVAFLKSIDPIDSSVVKAGLNSFTEEIRQRRRQEIIEAWLRNEFQVSGLSALMKDRGNN